MSEKEDALAAVILALMPEKGVAVAVGLGDARDYANAYARDYANAYAYAHARAYDYDYAYAHARAYDYDYARDYANANANANAYTYTPFTEGQKAQIDAAYTLLFT